MLTRGILALGRRLRAERPAGSVSLSGLAILGTLHRHGPLVATRIAAEERLAPQSLTRLIGELERSRLIARVRSETDRRAITIAITDKGLQALLADLDVRRAWLEEAVTSLTAAERKTLFAASSVMHKLAVHDG